jgi:hypothetical protein
MGTSSEVVSILEDLWPKNKAKGLLAQSVFVRDVQSGTFGSEAIEKVTQGCWLMAPREVEFYKFRFSFFVHPSVERNDTAAKWESPRDALGDKIYRPFHAVAEFISEAGIGVNYVVPTTADGRMDLDRIAKRDYSELKWGFFEFVNGRFVPKDLSDFFEIWGGKGGKVVKGKCWENETRQKVGQLGDGMLMRLLLNELFYSGYVKRVMHIPTNDPYDVDSFLMSLSQKHIFPMEIKEKSPRESSAGKYFGIDAGRVMMLLRMCVPNDANAVYLIRELDESGNFVGWKYVTLGEILMTAGWNLQQGGTGMGGQATQVIRLPYERFRAFGQQQFSEQDLRSIGNLPDEAKAIAKQLGGDLISRFHH